MTDLVVAQTAFWLRCNPVEAGSQKVPFQGAKLDLRLGSVLPRMLVNLVVSRSL